MKLSMAARNARLDALDRLLTGACSIEIYDGYIPASCDDAPDDKPLVTIRIGGNMFEPAIDAGKDKSDWYDGTAVRDGKPSYFRARGSDGICHIQGVIGADMILDKKLIKAGQLVRVEQFLIIEGNN